MEQVVKEKERAAEEKELAALAAKEKKREKRIRQKVRRELCQLAQSRNLSKQMK